MQAMPDPPDKVHRRLPDFGGVFVVPPKGAQGSCHKARAPVNCASSTETEESRDRQRADPVLKSVRFGI